MVRMVKTMGAKPIIAGMQIPPNYGREYTTAFKKLFEELALSEETALIPFFLDGIADNAAMFQADTIHPNEEAQPFLLSNVQKVLLPLLNP